MSFQKYWVYQYKHYEIGIKMENFILTIHLAMGIDIIHMNN